MTIVFYDGTCGLCHHFVRFLLALDKKKPLFHFAPLQGKTFRRKVPAKVQAQLPDSIVVLDPRGRLLTRTHAVLFTLTQLGGFWGWTGRLGAWFPTRLADWLYDLIAAVRHRFFTRPRNICPTMSSELKKRFYK